MSKHFFEIHKTVAELVAILVLALLPRATNAAVQVISVDEPPVPANYFHREIDIPQFEASLGTLQSVTIDLQVTGEFVEGPHREMAMGHDLRIVLETADHERLISLQQSENSFDPHRGRDHDFWGADNSSDTYVQPVTAKGETTLTSPEDLKQFTGSGLVDLFLSVQDTGAGGRMPECRDLLNGFWTVGANLKVIYNFVPVPESSTWLAGGFAVILLVATGFKRGNAAGEG